MTSWGCSVVSDNITVGTLAIDWCTVTFGTAGRGLDGWHTLTVPNVAAHTSRASVPVLFGVLLHLVQHGGAWTGDTLTVPNVAAQTSRASVPVPFGVLLHLVQQGGAWTGDTLTVPNVASHTSRASVPVLFGVLRMQHFEWRVCTAVTCSVVAFLVLLDCAIHSKFYFWFTLDVKAVFNRCIHVNTFTCSVHSHMIELHVYNVQCTLIIITWWTVTGLVTIDGLSVYVLEQPTCKCLGKTCAQRYLKLTPVASNLCKFWGKIGHNHPTPK